MLKDKSRLIYILAVNLSLLEFRRYLDRHSANAYEMVRLMNDTADGHALVAPIRIG
jgi:hypothetical protein